MKQKEEIFGFGKVAYNGKRRINLVTVRMTLKQLDDGFYTFTASGDIWNSTKTDCLVGGQCFDEIAKYIHGNQLFQQIRALHARNHLNDMHAGTPAQEAAIKEAKENGILPGTYDYTKACEYLRVLDRYEDNGYKYGTAWLRQEISAEDLEAIKQLIGWRD